VVEELTLALKATEVEPVKEALAEAAIHNLSTLLLRKRKLGCKI